MKIPLTVAVLWLSAATCVSAQSPSSSASDAASQAVAPGVPTVDAPSLPQAPSAARPLGRRAQQTPEQLAEADRVRRLPNVNGKPYDQPSVHDQVVAYAKDTYGVGGFAGTIVRSLYSEARDKPSGWGQDAAGYGQRFGAAEFVTIVNGNVRLGMELLFHEDLRYLPCDGCSVGKKIENALLAEITARHDENGRRFFTLTPTISDFAGPIIAHAAFYPGASSTPLSGVVATRTVFAQRIGFHVLQEFLLDPTKMNEKLRKVMDKLQRPKPDSSGEIAAPKP